MKLPQQRKTSDIMKIICLMKKANKYHDDFITNQTSYNANIDRNDFNRSIYEQEMVIDRLMKKFRTIKTVKNPRDVLSYFQEEFHRLSIHNDHSKYNILVENGKEKTYPITRN